MCIRNFIKKFKRKVTSDNIQQKTTCSNNINNNLNSAVEFFHIHYNKLHEYENELVNINILINNKISADIDEQIELCKNAMKIYNEYKEFCFLNGSGGVDHFNQMKFEFITTIEARLNFLENNRDVALNEILNEKKKLEFQNTASTSLIEFISKNNGIIQKELYKEFDIIFKDIIQSKLYFLAKDNKITRIKYGNSYKLFINNKDS